MIDWMSESFFILLAWIMIGSGVVTMITLLLGMKAHYGRYAPVNARSIPARWGWLIQEAPSFLLPAASFWEAPNLGCKVIILLIVAHYTNRTFIFPLQLKNPKPTPLSIVASAFVFCLWNGYLQGFYHAWYYTFEPGHFRQPISILGFVLFFGGMAINLHSDEILRNLRKEGETEYKIPRGGMFEYVSGANFFGEIIEWFGYFLVARSLPAAAFSFFTFANIGPRAIQHHQWYKEKFDNYPRRRKALIPFIL
ncbi:hypothetical protein PRIPAC_73226 [Pristionchus pacificus]|uniref:3-oxo-5alpha-steroid 4-dehydrogenase (NADP(+)) n=1 Tax=Pristionchus pacificus TaxID=54126 RepID=A0A2A6CS98_PRIPA|nr:hypothetical protein PRIPAC_73226 [Pristionchus pacificus]|eukprot:PDM80913.1 hypothetical protein PRIPAC_35916 [Pristionchus pacificus]